MPFKQHAIWATLKCSVRFMINHVLRALETEVVRDICNLSEEVILSKVTQYCERHHLAWSRIGTGLRLVLTTLGRDTSFTLRSTPARKLSDEQHDVLAMLGYKARNKKA